jgi:hypothetical protein
MKTLSGGGWVVQDGLIFYADAANVRGTSESKATWYDLSKNMYDGSYTGGVTFSADNLGLYRFDGTGYFNFGTVPISGTDLTISIFVRHSSLAISPAGTGVQMIFSRYSGGGISSGGELFLNSTGFVFGGRENATYYSTSAYTGVVTGRWYNLCGTKSGNVWSLYVNGVLHNSVVGGTGTVNLVDVGAYVGVESAISINSYAKLAGDAACPMIYNRALSATEVLQNYDTMGKRFGLT